MQLLCQRDSITSRGRKLGPAVGDVLRLDQRLRGRVPVFLLSTVNLDVLVVAPFLSYFLTSPTAITKQDWATGPGRFRPEHMGADFHPPQLGTADLLLSRLELIKDGGEWSIPNGLRGCFGEDQQHIHSEGLCMLMFICQERIHFARGHQEQLD